jgi:DNA-directed RNA polymerase specialized sigma24 family protein
LEPLAPHRRLDRLDSFDVASFRCNPSDRAWEDLVRRYGGRLYGRILHALRTAGFQPDSDEPGEILQDVYCRLLDDGCRRLRRIRGWQEKHLAGYLLRVAERVTIDYTRRVRAERRRPGPWAGRAKKALDPSALLASGRDSPEDALLVKERRKLLLQECGRISGPRSRQRNERVLRMALDGWTSREISGALGGELGPNGVHSLLYRIRRGLEQKRARMREIRRREAARPSQNGWRNDL